MQTGGGDVGGLTGLVLDLVAALGPVGVGLLTAAETIVPPVPSEVVLPLGGYLANRGQLGLVAVLVAATIGSLTGALVLYAVARRVGHDRTRALVARIPLVEGRDVDRATEWFARHGRAAVFLGRLVPGVRSLVSIPAGTQHMPVLQFSLYTAAGSLLWNALLVGVGYALGTQWQLVERYSTVLDVLVVGAVVVLVALGVRRRVRERRSAPAGP